MIDRRDALGIAQTNLSSTLQSLMANTTRLEADHAKTMETNRALAATFVDLSSKNQTLRDDAMEVASMRAHLDQAKKNTETAATRRTIMKSVVSAIVAGSGVDWARDEHLRALVLDNEDEVE